MGITRLISKGLKEQLVQEKILDENTAEQAQKKAEERGESFLETAVGMGFVSESDVVDVLVRTLNLPCIDAARYFADRDLLNCIPPETIVNHRILPLEKIGGILIVAICDYIEQTVINAVEKKTGLEVRLYVTPYSAYTGALKELDLNKTPD